LNTPSAWLLGMKAWNVSVPSGSNARIAASTAGE
jgi:hypothetical protein